MTYRILPFFWAALALVVSARSGVAAPSPTRNVKIVTYNVQFLPAPHGNDGEFSDENGNPLTDEERAKLIAENIHDSNAEIVALNEVFAENIRDIFISELAGKYGYRVDKIDNGDPEDSGLMLFSRYPFEKMPKSLFPFQYPCGAARVVLNGIEEDCSGSFLGFVEHQCSPSYSWDIANQADCVSDKGAAMVRIALPSGERLHVVFSHFIASYSDDSVAVHCDKAEDRRDSMRSMGQMIVAGAQEELGGQFGGTIWSPDAANVVAIGDFNINGHLLHSQGNGCLDFEWGLTFLPQVSQVPFMSCHDGDTATCGVQRIMLDAWANDTSPADLGRTSSFDFTYDPLDKAPAELASGKRIDYILYRRHSPSTMAFHLNPMVPQHLTIEWPFSGAMGELSDHLPVGVDMLLPPEDVMVDYSTPPTARKIQVPWVGDPPLTPMALQVGGQMQWLRISGPPGTYTLRAIDTDPQIGFDVYHPEDLSRPIKPRKVVLREGFEYLLDNPPYFVRTFAQLPGGGHEREKVGNYHFQVHRHDCTLPNEPCALVAGGAGQAVEWPAVPVGPVDAMWFTFEADASASGFPTHEISVAANGAPLPVPAFDLAIFDPLTNQELSAGLIWAGGPSPPERWATAVTGVPNNGSGDPLASSKTWLLRVQRPTLGYTGGVTVGHSTNLTYFVPMSLRIKQEEDDWSAHDELMIYRTPDALTFYQTITDDNDHHFALWFEDLPKIDELEDGGKSWPMTYLGVEKYTGEMPLVLLEDDEFGTLDSDDFLLIELSTGALSTAGGRAVDELPMNETYRKVRWRWSDKNPLPTDPDDTSYWYEMDFYLSHVPPCSMAWGASLPACQ